MIFRILFIFIIFMEMGAFAKTKIALIGDSKKTIQVADMVLAKMADNDDLEFLERAAIEKVLKEHKLAIHGISSLNIAKSSILNVDLFAVISSRLQNRKHLPAHLTVYNARSGCRLLNTKLPAEIEDCAKLMKQKLLDSVKQIKYPKDNIYLATVGIRDIGIPNRFKNLKFAYVMELERQLGNLHNVVILERNLLEYVNKEKNLTKEFFNLYQSSQLLDFEFFPGNSADMVNISIILSNVKKQKIAEFKVKDAFKSIPESINKLVNKIAKKLKRKFVNKLEGGVKEAEYFYQEFLFLKKYAEGRHFYGGQNRRALKEKAMQKLEAAIALNPYSFLYQLAWLKNKMRPIMLKEGTVGIDKRVVRRENRKSLIKYSRELIAFADQFKHDFPDKSGGYRAIERLFTQWAILYQNPVTGRHEKADSESRLILKELVENLRPKFYRDKADAENWNKGRVSEKKLNLEGFDDFYKNYNNIKFKHFYDEKEFVDCFMKYKELEMRFYVKNNIFYPLQKSRYKYSRYINNLFDLSYRTGSYNLYRQIILKSDNLIKLMLQDKDRTINDVGLLLQILREAHLKPEKKSTWSKKYYQWKNSTIITIDETLQSYKRQYRWYRSNKSWFDTHFPSRLERYSKVMPKIKPKFTAVEKENIKRRLAKHKEYNIGWYDIVTKIKKIKYPQQAAAIIKNIKTLEKYRSKNEVKIFYKHKLSLYYELFSKTGNKIYLKAIQAMTPQINISTIYILPSGYFYNFSKNNNMIYLTESNKLYAIDCTRKKKAKIISVGFQIQRIANDEQHIILSGYKNNILVIDRHNLTKLTDIRDMPIGFADKIAIMNKRIYAWGQGTLFSCNMKGNKRKIELSLFRSKKRHEFEKKESIKMLKVFTDPLHKRILLLYCQDRVNGRYLWINQTLAAYYPETGKIKNLHYNNGRGFQCSRLSENTLLLYNTQLNMFEYDLRVDSSKLLFAHNSEDKRIFPKLSIKYYLYIELIQDKQLWGRKYFIKVNENIYDVIPLHIGITGNYCKIYGGTNNKSMIFINGRVIYEFTPKIKIKEH